MQKIVVFDLDETMGYFTQLGVFCDALDHCIKDNEYSNKNFNQLLDLYSDYLRPNILKLCNYLKKMKKKKKCDQIMIYTNNQGPKIWAENIKNYFNKKMDMIFFDQIIAAFKINGQKIEMCRTSHDKSFNDFINCTKLKENVQLCFLDDRYHEGMDHKNVYYINVKPYTYYYDFSKMISMFLQSKMGEKVIEKINKKELDSGLVKYLERYKLSYVNKDVKRAEEEFEIDKLVSKKIMIHLNDFFYNRKPLTLKKKMHKKRENKKTIRVKLKDL